MTSPARENERLRDLYLEHASTQCRQSDDCPSTERLWEAVRGELPSAERRDIVLHLARCHECAQAWRIAKELATAAGELPTAVDEDAGSPRSKLFYLWPAAAAILVLALFVAPRSWFAGSPPGGFRDPADARSVGSLVSEHEPLPRERFLLRWTPGPEGSRYDVRVTTNELELLVAVNGLLAAEYQVPADALEAVASGSRLLWRVEVVPPTGGRWTSPTFFCRVE